MRMNELLPIKSSKNQLLNLSDANKIRIMDFLRKGSKIATSMGVCVGGMMAMLANPIFGGIIAVSGLYETGKNIIYKTEPGVDFSVRRKFPFINSKYLITQDVSLSPAIKMSGFDRTEKASMMILQLLVGLARYKDELADRNLSVNSNGVNVYSPIYSTKTHGVNLKTLEKLQDLDLIQIVKREPEPKQTLLFMEKLMFGNIDDVKSIFLASLRRDDAILSKYKVPAEDIEFRLTDKKVDFNDMFLKINGKKPFESNKEKVALNRFRTIFTRERGLLDQRGICIEKDSTGRDIIKRGKEKNEYGRKVLKVHEQSGNSLEQQRESFISRLKSKSISGQQEPDNNMINTRENENER